MSIEVEPDWWKTLFDEVYLMTDARSVCDEELSRREVDVICELMPVRPGQKILDLCGGQGRHSMELCARGHSGCTVVDYSQCLVGRGRRMAEERGFGVEFVQADARETGLPPDTFDHVLIMGNSLGYLPDPEDDRKILSEAYRVMRPGSWLLVDVVDGDRVKAALNPNAWHEVDPDVVVCREREIDGDSVRTREMVLCKKRGLIRERAYSIRAYGPDDLVALVSRVGFQNVLVHGDFSPHRKAGDYGFMNRRVIVTGRKPWSWGLPRT